MIGLGVATIVHAITTKAMLDIPVTLIVGICM
jgi:hypothetical protein